MILVTGGTGLVGSQILFDLAASGKRVVALRRKKSKMDVFNRLFKSHQQYVQNIKWVEGDITDPFVLDEVMKDIETIYHSAGFISFNPGDRKKMMKINVEGTANMINMALKNGVKRFCHVSSVAALGRISGEKYIDENAWWKTSKKNSNYAISKYGGEREVWRGIEEGLSAFIINPTIIIGPGEWTSGSSQLFSRVWNGLRFYTNGITGFVDVRDVSKSAIKLMEKGVNNSRFIINSENVSYRYVADRIAENFGRPKPKIKVPSAAIEVAWRVDSLISWLSAKNPMITKETGRNSLMEWYYSNEKIKKEIDIEFISVEESVRNTCERFLSQKLSKSSSSDKNII